MLNENLLMIKHVIPILLVMKTFDQTVAYLPACIVCQQCITRPEQLLLKLREGFVTKPGDVLDDLTSSCQSHRCKVASGSSGNQRDMPGITCAVGCTAATWLARNLVRAAMLG